MIKILVNKLYRITKNRTKLEDALKVKITNRGREVFIEGKGENEFSAEKVLLALDFGFPYGTTLKIIEEGADFEIINIKDHTNRHDLERVRGRIIGKKGKTIQTLCTLTGCDMEIKDNTIGIIGNPELLENAGNAIISIIKGSKQGNVYAYLEKHRLKDEPDLGLKR